VDGTAVDEPVPDRIDGHAEVVQCREDDPHRRRISERSACLASCGTTMVANRERGFRRSEPLDRAFENEVFAGLADGVGGDLE